MKALIEQRLKLGKALLISIYAIVIALVLSIALCSIRSYADLGIVIIFVLLEALFSATILYAVIFIPLKRSLKLINEDEFENLTSDISLNRPTLPRSRIYCGEKAFFGKKPWVIIPYSEIAWVYFSISVYLCFPVRKTIVIYTKSGKKFELHSCEKEFGWLFFKRILIYSPGVIFGHGKEQRMRYDQMRREISKQSYQSKEN